MNKNKKRKILGFEVLDKEETSTEWNARQTKGTNPFYDSIVEAIKQLEVGESIRVPANDGRKVTNIRGTIRNRFLSDEHTSVSMKIMGNIIIIQRTS